MYIKQIDMEGVDFVKLAHDRVLWCTVLDTAIHSWGTENVENFLLAEKSCPRDRLILQEADSSGEVDNCEVLQV
jgi:hypothetical protein